MNATVEKQIPFLATFCAATGIDYSKNCEIVVKRASRNFLQSVPAAEMRMFIIKHNIIREIFLTQGKSYIASLTPHRIGDNDYDYIVTHRASGIEWTDSGLKTKLDKSSIWILKRDKRIKINSQFKGGE